MWWVGAKYAVLTLVKVFQDIIGCGGLDCQAAEAALAESRTVGVVRSKPRLIHKLLLPVKFNCASSCLKLDGAERCLDLVKHQAISMLFPIPL